MTRTIVSALSMVAVLAWTACGNPDPVATDAPNQGDPGGRAILTTQTTAALAQSSIDQLQIKNQSQGLKDVSAYVPEGLRGSVPADALRA